MEAISILSDLRVRLCFCCIFEVTLTTSFIIYIKHNLQEIKNEKVLSAYKSISIGVLYRQQSRLLTDIFISIPNTKPCQYILFDSLPVPASMVGSSRLLCSSVVKVKLSLFPLILEPCDKVSHKNLRGHIYWTIPLDQGTK